MAGSNSDGDDGERDDLLDKFAHIDPANYTDAEAAAFQAALDEREAQLPPRRVLPPDLAELYDEIRLSVTLRLVQADDTPVPFERFEVYDAMMGGMGLVLKARDPELERWVAIKLWIQSGPAAQEALLAEARTLAKLSHPNVVTIYDTGKWRDRTYFVMEWIEGVDGSAWMQELTLWQTVRDAFVLAGEGLAAAHAVGIQHRDFKPANMLIGNDWRVVVADFGVADSLRTHADPEVRRESSLVGTLHYMAPERLLGERGDARSDQFSFCVAMWRALYKARPFRGETAEELLFAIENATLWRDPLADVPQWLGHVVVKGLASDPDNRYPDMRSLLRALLSDESPDGWVADDSFGSVADDDGDRMVHAPHGEVARIWTAQYTPANASVLPVTQADEHVLARPGVGDRRSSPWIVFAGPVALLGVVALAMVMFARQGAVSTFSVNFVGPRVEQPAGLEQPCVVEDVDIELDPVISEVCRLIRTDQFEASQMLWEREVDRRGDSPDAAEGTIIIAQTFVARAGELEDSNPTLSERAAVIATYWARAAAGAIADDDPRLLRIRSEVSRLTTLQP